MNLFGIDTPQQSGFSFPHQPLTEKYRPARIQEFAGLDKVKRILTKFAANPQAINFYFLGPSGTGKTSMAFALARELGAEVHHLPSQKCTLDALERTVYRCHLAPLSGHKFHMILIDEADMMSDAAQKFCLSRLDGTAPCPDTIWVFTGNGLPLDPTGRFQSRVMVMEFSSYGISSEATALLQRIWNCEVGDTAPAPNLGRIVKDSSNNIRESLMNLQRAILDA